MSERTNDLSQIDFEQGEKIELTGINPDQHSSLQYFSTRSVFKDRLNALMTWVGKTDLDTIYGTIAINEAFLDEVDSADAIAKFEDIFIRNIRVPRKYTPPVASDNKKRNSDSSGYKNVRGNFDLACRTPGVGGNPHLLEFVLYDCSYDDALTKTKTFEGFARDLGLNIQIEILHYTGQSIGTRKKKPRFSLGMSRRRANKKS